MNMEISKEEYQYLVMCKDLLHYFVQPTIICPNCKKAIIAKGYSCMICGFNPEL